MQYNLQDTEAMRELRAIYDYDPETGALRRLVGIHRNTHLDGMHPVNENNGYRMTGFMTRGRRVSSTVGRLAWLWMTGRWPVAVGHRNGDYTDDRWENLFEMPEEHRGRTAKFNAANKSGHRGISWERGVGRWTVFVTREGENVRVGRFDDLDDAVIAWHLADRDPQAGPCTEDGECPLREER